MPQNGQTHFKNLPANTARFLKCVWPLCIKGLKMFLESYLGLFLNISTGTLYENSYYTTQ